MSYPTEWTDAERREVASRIAAVASDDTQRDAGYYLYFLAVIYGVLNNEASWLVKNRAQIEAATRGEFGGRAAKKIPRREKSS